MVLEANDYVGGRSKSTNIDDSINVPNNASQVSNVPIDWGSEWLYIGSNMEEYLKENGFKWRRFGYGGGRLLATLLVLLARRSIVYSQFYMQSIGDDGTIDTEVLEDAETMQLRRRFLFFRDKLLEEEEVQSYFSSVITKPNREYKMYECVI